MIELIDDPDMQVIKLKFVDLVRTGFIDKFNYVIINASKKYAEAEFLLKKLQLNRRALSPIFATMMLVTIVVVLGSVAFYFSYNLTTTAADQYSSNIANSQQAVSERVGFENVLYDSTSKSLTVWIINFGSANNIRINMIFIYDVNHNIVGQPYSGSSISPLHPILDASLTPTPTPTIITGLNVGMEAYFTVTQVTQPSGQALVSGSIYTIHLITQSGSSFDYVFTA